MNEQQSEALEVPENWNNMTKEQQTKWVEDALTSIGKSVRSRD